MLFAGLTGSGSAPCLPEATLLAFPACLRAQSCNCNSAPGGVRAFAQFSH